MNTADHILSRSVAQPFYRQHAGAFLFLFLLLFGIQPSFADALKFHYALSQGILSNFIFFLFAFAAWSFYTFKTVYFFYQCLKREAYDFLFELNALPVSNRFVHFLKLSTVVLLPVEVHALLLLLVGFREHLAGNGLLMLLAASLLVLTGALFFLVLLNRAKAVQQVTSRRSSFTLYKNLHGFLMKFLLRRQFIALLVTKILSFGALYFFSNTDTNVFEDRMLWLLLITSLAGHSMLVYRNFHFLEQELGIYRNLPLCSFSILSSLCMVYCLLIIPEAWALRGMMVIQHRTADYIWMVLTGPSFLLLLHALLYTRDMSMEEFLQLLFGVWIVCIFFSLSSNHWLLPLVCLSAGILIFCISWRQYEKEAATFEP